MNILIVDTDSQILEQLEAELQAEGHEVSTCGFGSQALTKSLMYDFDLLITELTLPDLPGTEIIRAVKAQAPHIAVIVISSLDINEWRGPSQAAGAACFLHKPLDISELKNELHYIEMGRAEMKVGVIDPNFIHRTRMTKTFEHLGCDVSAWPDVLTALQEMAKATRPSLLLIDTSVELTMEALEWAREKRVLVFVYADSLDDTSHDELMRAGAALILTKPVDAEALMTQARFMAHH